jgi:hypothetical protein
MGYSSSSMQVIHKAETPPGAARRWLIERLVLSSPTYRQPILKKRKGSDRRGVSHSSTLAAISLVHSR